MTAIAVMAISIKILRILLSLLKKWFPVSGFQFSVGDWNFKIERGRTTYAWERRRLAGKNSRLLRPSRNYSLN